MIARTLSVSVFLPLLAGAFLATVFALFFVLTADNQEICKINPALNPLISDDLIPTGRID
jgi:hypothetical protein